MLHDGRLSLSARPDHGDQADIVPSKSLIEQGELAFPAKEMQWLGGAVMNGRLSQGRIPNDE
jgi:hypothetical protein